MAEISCFTMSLCSEAIVAMPYAAAAGCWNLVLMYLYNRAQYTYVKQLSGIRPFGRQLARAWNISFQPSDMPVSFEISKGTHTRCHLYAISNMCVAPLGMNGDINGLDVSTCFTAYQGSLLHI